MCSLSFFDRIRFCIFDFDGTIVDSMHAWDDLATEWLNRNNFSAPPDLNDQLETLTVTEASHLIKSMIDTPLTPRQIVNAWMELLRERYLRTVSLKPGAVECVQTLKAKGKRVCLATSCIKEVLEAFLEQHELQDLFEFTIFTDDVKRDKSHPDIFRACQHRMGSGHATEYAVFEDMPSASSGVRAAGMNLVAVHDPKWEKEWNSFQAMADYSIKSYRDLRY